MSNIYSTTKNKQGFTLVELSIVLVIIGLLIGGILVGQSLIDSAKFNKFASKLSQYDIAINLFQEKFNSLPADSDFFGAITRTGSSAANNNRIESLNGDDNHFDQEIAAFWPVLSQSGMVKETFTSNSLAVAGTSIPKLEISEIETAGIVVGSPNEGGDIFQNDNVYLLVVPSPAGNTLTTASGGTSYPLKPLQMLALDKKIDDGLPQSGIMTTSHASEFGGPYGSNNNCGVTAYTTTDSIICAAKIKILSINADLN